MAVKDWPLWRVGVFRNTKAMVSSPARATPVIRISETGVVSRERLPMSIGFITDTNKLTWMVVHPLKIWLEEESEQVQLIDERSYFPLDPFKRYTEEDRKSLQQLDEIALMCHDNNKAQVVQNSKNDTHTTLLGRITTLSFAVIIICLILQVLVK